MRRKLISLGVGCAMFVSTASFAFAQGPKINGMMGGYGPQGAPQGNFSQMNGYGYGMMQNGYGMMMQGFMSPFEYKSLNLTPTQQNEIKQLQADHFKEMQQLMQEFFNKMNSLSGNSTINDVQAIRSDFFNKMIKERNNYLAQLKKILTKEQMEQFYNQHPYFHAQ